MGLKEFNGKSIFEDYFRYFEHFDNIINAFDFEKSDIKEVVKKEHNWLKKAIKNFLFYEHFFKVCKIICDSVDKFKYELTKSLDGETLEFKDKYIIKLKKTIVTKFFEEYKQFLLSKLNNEVAVDKFKDIIKELKLN